MTKKIIFTAGGSGGHIFPAINLMKHFSKKGFDVVLATDERGKKFIKDDQKIQPYILNAGTPTNKNILKKILSFFTIFFSIIKAIIILKKEKPDLVFGFGGYVSFPISFTSRFFNLPLVIYENNIILGRANKYLLTFAKKILLAKKIENLPDKYKYKAYEVGPILEKKIINYADYNKPSDKKDFSVLVIGGSQGAEIFGTIIPSVIKMLKEKGRAIQIKQQCSKDQKNKIIDFYKKNEINNYVFEFDKNMLELILSSDLAITRCGASTTAELTHTLTPFIAVPIPQSIDNHQYLNAKYYEERGCCWILEQNSFTIENLFKLMEETINNKKKLEEIRKNMKKNDNKNVYTNVENQVNEFIEK